MYSTCAAPYQCVVIRLTPSIIAYFFIYICNIFRVYIFKVGIDHLSQIEPGTVNTNKIRADELVAEEIKFINVSNLLCINSGF